MVKLSKDIKGSTLVEVIMAMVILLISTGLAFLIFSQLSTSSLKKLKFQSKLEIEQLFYQTKEENSSFSDSDYQSDNFLIEQRVLDYELSVKGLKQINYKAIDVNGNIISELNFLINTDEN